MQILLHVKSTTVFSLFTTLYVYYIYASYTTQNTTIYYYVSGMVRGPHKYYSATSSGIVKKKKM